MVSKGLRDLDMVRKLMRSAKGAVEAQHWKKVLHDMGYVFAMSLYGVLTKFDGQRSEYRRIEIYSQALLTSEDVELIYRWFQTMHPMKTYTIWAYDHEEKRLLEVFDTW